MQFDEMKQTLIAHKNELQKRGARSIALFGSVVRNEATEESDVNVLVNFEVKRGLFAFAGLKLYLEELLGCEVHLATRRALHPALKDQILKEAKTVFKKRSNDRTRSYCT